MSRIHPLDIAGDRLLARFFGRSLRGLTSRAQAAPMRHVEQTPFLEEAERPPDAMTLAVSEIAALLDQAALSARQRLVLIRRAEGWTYEAIGAAEGISMEAACKSGEAGREKLRRAIEATALVGLHDAYLEETSRGLGFRRVFDRP